MNGEIKVKSKYNQGTTFIVNITQKIIKQKLEKGYTTTSDDGIEDSGYVVIDGVTNEVRKINYSYLNSYSVSTTVDISAEVQYDKNMTAGMFALMLTNSNNTSDDLQYADEFGIVNFNTISYDNVDGTFNYVVSQVNTNVKKVVYDTNTFVVSVILTNDGNGTLNKEIKYYNKLGEEVSEIVFKNEYLPNGLVINNVNSSDYVDSSKVFKYRLEITNSPDSVGYYDVVDSKGETLIDLVIDENGEALYEFELTSDERITVLELPEGTNYTVTQELVDYYTTTIEDLNYNIDTDNGVIIYSAVTPDSTVQINFNNNYVTSGEFTPSSVVKLLDKVLEKDEFTFMIKDVSEGLTNGYVEFITNSFEGDLKYTTIEYTRPGTYVSEITQVKGDSNHIKYDLSKCILTLVLVDNGNSTMSVLSAKYEYENGKEGFENVYSSEPIVPPIESPSQNENPNTAEKTSKYGFVMIMLIFVCVLFVIERYTRRKRLNA
jgi:pilin isopeptide linkage protein